MNAVTRRWTVVIQWTALLIALPAADGQIADDTQLRRISPSDKHIPGRNLDELSLFNDLNREFEQRVQFEPETKFASQASRVLALYNPGRLIPPKNKLTGSTLSGSKVTRTPVSAAEALLGLLNDQQSEKVLQKIDSPERVAWTNLPPRPNAGGLRLGDMNEAQIKAVCDLLANVLSPTGCEKIRLIMLADDQLVSGGRARPGFGTEYFSIVIFGKPSQSSLWAIQLDGHHVGLNVAIKGNAITLAPSFIGTQPVRYSLGGHDIEPMKAEVELAFKLANELTEEQFRKALTSDQRGRIKTGPGHDNRKLEPLGLLCNSLNQQQQNVLLTLIGAWINDLPADQAIYRMREIFTEFDQMSFAWSGSRKSGSDVSYIIQSPSLIIEFAYQDLGGDPLNHLHTQYRNPKNEYGRNWLKQLDAPQEDIDEDK